MPTIQIPRPLSEEALFKMLSEHPAFSNPMVNVAVSTLTLSAEKHDGKTINLDLITGVTLTLPKATGSGAKFLIKVKTLATSNSHIVKVGNGTDVMNGIIHCLDSNLATVNMFGFATAADSDTITLDRTNTGSVTLGEWIEVEDYVSGRWHVRGVLSGAAPATPFSAGVA